MNLMISVISTSPFEFDFNTTKFSEIVFLDAGQIISVVI